MTSTEMAGGSPPVNIDICMVLDVLPIAMSVKTVISDKSMEMDTPDGVVSRMEMTGGSPPAEIDISRGLDMLQISVTATEIAGVRAYSHQRCAFFSAAEILLQIYQNPMHLNGTRSPTEKRRPPTCPI